MGDEDNKIQSWHWVILVLIALSFFSLKIYSLHWPEANIKLAGQNLRVLVAKDSYHLTKGLSGRKDFGDYDGMIFIFNEFGRHAIVMRDMEFSIDIVWFSGAEVVDIAPRVPLDMAVSEANLKRYYPRIDANLVLELPAGWTEDNGVRIGDRIEVLEG